MREAQGSWIETYSSKRLRDILKLGRRRIRLLTGFLTSHWGLRHYLLRMGIKTYDAFRHFFTIDETEEHILCECESHWVPGQGYCKTRGPIKFEEWYKRSLYKEVVAWGERNLPLSKFIYLQYLCPKIHLKIQTANNNLKFLWILIHCLRFPAYIYVEVYKHSKT